MKRKCRQSHQDKVSILQKEVREFFHTRSSTQNSLALHYRTGYSNTTRSKSYKNNSQPLNCGFLDQILEINPDSRIAHVEPRVTMDKLVRATLPYGLIPAVVPEFKGITVSGAVLGGAAESSSFRYGTFNDICSSFELIIGDGTLLKVTPEEHSDLFYGIASSYGSLGMLTSIEIRLIPVNDYVHLYYHFFSDPQEALLKLQTLCHSEKPDFLEGIVFSKDKIVIIEGFLQSQSSLKNRSSFSLNATSKWYFQHAQKMSQKKEEVMPIYDYLFRHDQGAFWMGTYLLRMRLLLLFLGQGVFKFFKSNSFSKKEIHQFHSIKSPLLFKRFFSAPFMTSQRLWHLLHKAEKWVQNRFVIQDFCIPENNAFIFLQDALENLGLFPLWLCPIKGTKKPQIFSPHLLKTKDPFFINVGIYGLPEYNFTIKKITRELEQKTKVLEGRKVLYSHSYYTEEDFWHIYSKTEYENLRTLTKAKGVWKEITEKVLSI